MSVAAASTPGISLSKRAGLHLPVRAVKRRVNDGAEWKMRCGPASAIYLCAQVQYAATIIAGTAAKDASVFSDDYPKRKGVVTSESVDGLVVRDASRTFATLMRRSVPYHPHTVRSIDTTIVSKAATKPKRVKRAVGDKPVRATKPKPPAEEEEEEKKESDHEDV